MKSAAVGLAALLLAACAPPPPLVHQASADPAACDQENYDWLMGRDAGALPADRLPENRRVFDQAMKVTQDYAGGRLNIVYDATSGKVVRVYCG